jgi:pseudaminic acid synthase
VIEKHFIMDRTLGGPDAAFSLEPNEFKEMIDSVRLMEKALGSEKITLTPQAQKSRVFARSLYVVEDIKKGDLFTLKNVRSIRPGHGLPPKKLPNILGKKATQDIEKGTALSENLIQ